MQILEGPVTYARAAIREEAWRRVHVVAGFDLLNAVPCVEVAMKATPSGPPRLHAARSARSRVVCDLAALTRPAGSSPTPV